ncbi:MAG: hypothetical protein KGY74_09100 [Candidatus Cloacimonetes bacterium]|nr:hypothetical protein [Candidatus Cloacimonadota bacterium]
MKYSIIKIALIAIIISAFVIIGSANAEVTKSSAKDLVLNQILVDEVGSIDIYQKITSMTISDSIFMYNNEGKSSVELEKIK